MTRQQKIQNLIRGAFNSIKAGPTRFVVPGVAVALSVALVMSSYSPLVYQPPEAQAQTASQTKLLHPPKEKKKSKANAPTENVSSSAKLKDGTWTGYAACTESGVFDYYLALDVTVEGGKVVRISNVRGSATGNAGSPKKAKYSAADNEAYLRKASLGVVSQLLSDAKKGTISNSVDAVSGATYSSYAILSAYHDALKKAGAGTSSSSNVPAKPVQKAPQAAQAKDNFSSKTKFADGTYTGYAECREEDTFDYYLALDVTIKKGKVVGISNVRGSATGNAGDAKKSSYSASDNDSYLKRAAQGVSGNKGVIDQLFSAAKQGKISSSVDTVSGATYSSKSMLLAYYDALKKAAKAAGSKAKISDPSASVPGVDQTQKTDSNTKKEKPSSIVVDKDATFFDGTYTAYAYCEDAGNKTAWKPYYLGVTITVTNGSVALTDIFGDTKDVADPAYVYDEGENVRYLKRAINGYGISGKHPGLKQQITTQIDAGTPAGSYDTISGATYSSEAIIEAYQKVLKMAQTKPNNADANGTAGGTAEDSSQTNSSDESSTHAGDDASKNAATNSSAAVEPSRTSEGAQESTQNKKD